jgi:heptosyltransferase-1
MRVLIIKTSSMGDIIHALPVLDYLHRAAPGIEIGWVVEENFAGLLAGNPLLSQLHVIATRRWRKSLCSCRTRREIAASIRELRSCNYDLAFDIQGNIKSGIICLASGVKTRIGLPRQLLQESFNALCTTVKAPLVPENGKHVIPRYLSVVRVPFELEYRNLELASHIPTSIAEDAAARACLSRLEPGRKVLFHCGTTWQTKFWSPEGWMELGRLVCNAFPDATLLFSWGSDSEMKTVSEIASKIGERAVVLERLSLKGLTALLKQVDLVVGGDTGPVHLAAAVGTPTVSLYRASDGEYSGPRGKRHVIVQSPLECTRCFHTTCARDEECRASITPTAMLEGIQRLLGPQDY